ncbi:hypothetical protein [Halarcobacter anaerophilus]|uniref:Uncharacterized protein n=1 Tax=Halarcobacter anaerophilus TaxID=877500 RepID=A0A4Q0Y5L2_9BACT|nr:hypothetical protein [Halarcobacter anaerophilus]QDF27726.1 hypothetical protein AANAER_0216 [Halarcobacter anaerophilus]RXJ64069.1 hypothetical protein CRV06_03780 [Halarcobacter anaerophilus]
MQIKILKDIKTESLLIYVRSVLEDLTNQLENNKYKIDLKNPEISAEIKKNIYFLHNNLEKSVLTQKELARKLISTKDEKNRYKALAFYYNTLLQEIQASLKEGNHWIPEHIVFSLLCEWVIEEEKPISSFTFLNDVDYIKLLSFYEEPKSTKEYRKNLLKMYKISSSMIEKLKDSKFKNNKPKKSKVK